MKTPPVATALFLTAVAAQAQTTLVYRETFSSTTNNANLINAGWGVHHGNGVAYTNADLSNAAGLSNLTGRVTGVNNLNAGPMTTSPTNINTGGQNSTGFVFVSAGGVSGSGSNPGNAVLVWTNEAAITLTTTNLHSIDFHLGNSTGAQPVRVALRVGNAWYVSNTTFTTANIAGSTFGTLAEAKTLTFSSAASEWRTISFVAAAANPLTSNAASGNLTLGSVAGTDLSGNITGFGIYLNAGSTANMRFDTFTVTTAIPEPASAATLLGLGVLGLAAISRSRRPRG